MNKRYHEDNLLLDKARAGDENAYTKLFKVYYNVTLHSVKKFIKNEIDAEDITMITFEKAFTNLDKYAPTFGFGSWLFKVARNTCLDFLSMKKRRPSDFIDIFDTTFNAHHFDTPEEQFINRELGTNLEKAICSLQNNYQDVIRWRYFEDLDFKEIESKYGVNGNVARSYMFRARKELRKLPL